MDWGLFGAKPLFETNVAYCWLEPWEQIYIDIEMHLRCRQ